jgi:hypothetical protein
MTEYKTIVAACPTIPAKSATATLFLDSSPSSSASRYRSSYPCIALYDGGGKEFFFIILNAIQTADSCARSGGYQISVFFEHFRCSSDAQKNKFSQKTGPAADGEKNCFFYSFSVDPAPALSLNIFNNLMNALPTQIKLICNLTERRTGCAHLQNFRISICICSRTRLQWTPLPTRNRLDSRCALFRKLIFSASLAHVANPSSQCDIIIFNNFSMDGWNIAMSFARGELRKGLNIGIESCRVIHKPEISTTSAASRKQLTFNYLLQQNLTSGMRTCTISSAHGGAIEKSI